MQLPPLPTESELDQLPPDGGAAFNRLVFSNSPYLLQHAAQPVDWYEWGDEAFEAARSLHRPVFLSVGYATCHWCHVMARECFEDGEIASILNRSFVSIKVDREERPAVDKYYMEVCQAVTGRGGWPLTLFLTPDRKPFFAGTYFPPRGAPGRPGFTEILLALEKAWREDGQALGDDANRLVEEIRLWKIREQADRPAADADLRAAALKEWAERHDAAHGGFGGAPKFPVPHQYVYLLRHGGEAGRSMALQSLTAIARSGLQDHVGGGFHRYATDAAWHLPHFEKMLYDQALLLWAFAEGVRGGGGDDLVRAAEGIVSYLERDLAGSDGGFFAAEDADSEGEEGKFYLWRRDEIMKILGPVDGERWCREFQFEAEGNVHDEATGLRDGSNQPRRAPGASGWTPALEDLRRRLFAARAARPRPLLDDKVLSDWNGLAVAALSFAGRVMGRADWVTLAERAGALLLERLTDAEGRPIKNLRGGKWSGEASLDDYVFTAWGFWELYQSTLDPRWLTNLRLRLEAAWDRFVSTEDGVVHLAPRGSSGLPGSVEETYDGATPAGASVFAWLLAVLGRAHDQPSDVRRAELLMKRLAAAATPRPSQHAFALLAWEALREAPETLRVGADDAWSWITAAESVPSAGRVILHDPSVATAQRCLGDRCLAPAAHPDELRIRI